MLCDESTNRAAAESSNQADDCNSTDKLLDKTEDNAVNDQSTDNITIVQTAHTEADVATRDSGINSESNNAANNSAAAALESLWNSMNRSDSNDIAANSFINVPVLHSTPNK